MKIKAMNSIYKIAALSAAFISAAGGAAEVYQTDSSTLSVYGRVKAEALNGYGYQRFSAKIGRDDHPGLSLTARLGVSGESRIDDFFSAFGNFLYDLSAEDGIDAKDRMKIRFGYAGARFGRYGALTAGHQYPAAYNALSHIDVFEHFCISGNGSSLDRHGVGAAIRQDGIIKFQEDNLDGYSYALSYRFRDDGDNNRYGISASFGYETHSGIGLTAGYQFNRAADDSPVYTTDENGLTKASGSGDRTEAILGAYYGTYDRPGFYFAASYDHTKLSSADGLGDSAGGFRGDGFDAFAGYTTPGGTFTFGADWGYFKNQLAESGSGRAVNQIAGIVRWHITKQAYGIVQYVDNFGDGAHRKAHQDWLSIAAVYTF